MLVQKFVGQRGDRAEPHPGALGEERAVPGAGGRVERIAVLPDVPTALEQGLDGFEIGVWHGMYVPAGTPEPVKERLTDALQKALQDETVIRRFAELGTEPVPQEDATPQSLEKQYKEQIEFWRPLIEEAGEYAN